MGWLIFRRLATALPSLVGVVVVTFLLTRALPGDPAAHFAGPAATAPTIEEIRHRLGLDRSLPAQFIDYIGGGRRRDGGASPHTDPSGGSRLVPLVSSSLQSPLL